MSRETRSLPCKLTDDEVAQRAAKMAAHVHDLVGLEVKAKASAAEFKEEKGRLSAEVKILAAAVRHRAEVRDVEVEIVHDDIRFAVDVIRLDTGEVVSTRRMNADEEQAARQAKLPLGGARAARRNKDTGEA